ncbi:MAG: alpha/beta hydrolase [Actinomycetales bacterium]|nr:alpha/beta hydrolase [Actinomycetales bacterium]
MSSEELATLKGMLAAGGPDFSNPATEVRAMFDGMLATFPVDESFTFAERTIGGISGLWLDAPKKSDAVVLYLHGGAYLAGTSFGYRGLSGGIAQASGAVMFSIDYRLAPEHAYPAAIDDALAAYKGLLAEGFAAHQIIVSGDSAGGGLALALLISIREAGLVQPAGAVLLSPWTDLTFTGDTLASKAEVDNSLSEAGLRAAAGQHLAGHSATDPLVSPLFGDLTGLAPLLIEVGSDEILLSDSTRFAAKAGESLVDVTLHVWPEMVHDWSLFGFMLSEGRDMIAEAGLWASAKLEGK